MFPKLAIGQLCGFLFLFILLTSALSRFFAGAPLDPEDVPNALGAVAEGGKKFRISIVVDLLSHFSIIALAGLLYLAFSPYNKSLALVGTLWRVTEGIIIALNEINYITLLAVAQKFVSATGAEASVLETLGRTLIQAEGWGLKIALAFLALGHLLYAILFVSSGAVPSALGWLGILASILAAGGIWLNLINPSWSMVSFLALIPYELVLGFWLLLRGGQIGVQ
jgi:hypothetical protein